MAFRWILVVATIALLASLSVAQTSAAMELVNKVQIVNLATSNEIVTSVRSGDTVYAIVNPLELYSVNLAAVQNNQTTTPVKSSISPEEDTGVAYALDASNSRLLISTFSVSVYDINLGVSPAVRTNVEDYSGLDVNFVPRTSFIDASLDAAVFVLNDVVLVSKLSNLTETPQKIQLDQVDSFKTYLYNQNTKIAYLLGTDGKLSVINLNTRALVNSVSINNLNGIESAALDITRNILYVCGSSSGTATLARVDLTASQLDTVTEITFPSADLLSLAESSLCVTIQEDFDLGLAFVGVLSNFGSFGSIVRVDVANWLVAEVLSLSDTALDPAPVAITIDKAKKYANFVTQSELLIFSYPDNCPNGCTGKGACAYSKCACDDGWAGDDCSAVACDSDCGAPSGKGACTNGICSCSASWSGADCSIQRCPNDCSGHGDCSGPSGNYTCTCEDEWLNADCGTPFTVVCANIDSMEECLSRRYDCGWCYETDSCIAGNELGPVNGTCSEYYVYQAREPGIIVIALIFVAIFAIMYFINVVSMFQWDRRTAAYLGSDNNNVIPQDEVLPFIKRSWWRDERSQRAWKLFDQLQFIAMYSLINVAYPTRFILFTKYFNWSLFGLPLPWVNTADIYNRDHDPLYSPLQFRPGRTLNYVDQYSNSILLPNEYIFYSTMFWFGVACVGGLVVTAILMIARSCIKSKSEKNVTLRIILHQRPFYVFVRIVLAAYLPIVLTASYHTVKFFNLSIIGSVIALAVVGVGFAILAGIIVNRPGKDLFLLQMKARFGPLFVSYHYQKAKFILFDLGKRFLVAAVIGFLCAQVGDMKVYVWPQAFIAAAIYLAYLIILCVKQPYLDKTHFILDLVLTIINIICLGIALLHYNEPSQAGELIVVILQAVGLMFCLWSYIYCWLLMSRIPGFRECCMICCGKASRDDFDENLKKDEDDEDNEERIADKSPSASSSPRAGVAVRNKNNSEPSSENSESESASSGSGEQQPPSNNDDKSTSSALQISESAGES